MMHNTNHILTFLIVLASSSFSCFSKNSSTYANCNSPPFSCGGASFKISYPFYTDKRHAYCGHPKYFVNCTNNTALTIAVFNKEYQIKFIDYSNNLLNIVDYTLSSESCPKYFPNATIDLSLFQFSEEYNRNLTIYTNCNATVTPNQNLTNYKCYEADGGLVNQQIYFSLDHSNKGDTHGLCKSMSEIPVDQDTADKLINEEIGLDQAVHQGFYVKWTAGVDWCRDCKNSGGYCGSNSTKADGHICICPNGTFTGSCYSSDLDLGRKGQRRKLIIGVCIGSAAFLIMGFVLILMLRTPRRILKTFYHKRKTNHAQKIESCLEICGSLATKRYTYSNVKKMTSSFKEKIGQGGYGSVYKGKLASGHEVAVKLLSETKGNGEDFINEVAAIGNASHVNVVSLRGFCVEGSKRALIYDFMPNGSLDKYIYSKKGAKDTTLAWDKLYDIAIGIARGLEYLHRGSNTRIVHFDIKPNNILLDQNFCPKITDFGMAKLCPPKQSIISMYGTRGTVGYIAPEVFSRSFGAVSSKSDVYSFGMMLLELFGHKRKDSVHLETTSENYFPQSIYQHIDGKDDFDLVEYGVTGENEEIAKKLMIIGFWCIQTMPENRPIISKVVEMLEGSTSDLSVPPKPTLSSPVDVIASSCVSAYTTIFSSS